MLLIFNMSLKLRLYFPKKKKRLMNLFQSLVSEVDSVRCLLRFVGGV